MKRTLRSLWPWSARSATEPSATTRSAAEPARADSEIDARIETWLSGSLQGHAAR